MKTESQNAADFMAQREATYSQRIMDAKKSGKNPTWSGTLADGKRTALSARHAKQVPETATKSTRNEVHPLSATPSTSSSYPSCMTWTVLTIMIIIGICLCKMGFKTSAHA